MHKMIIGWWILLISRSFPFASMKNPHCSQKGLRFSMTSNLQEDTEYLMLKGCYSTSWLEAFNFLNLLKNPVWVTDTYYLRTNLFFFFFIRGLNPRDRGDFLLVWILLPEGRKSDKIFDQTQKPNKGPSIRSDEHHIGDTGGYKEIKKPATAKWKESRWRRRESLRH